MVTRVQPLLALVAVQALGLLALALWWLTMPAPERQQRLLTLAALEDLDGPLPSGVLEQLPWMIEARWQRLEGTVGLLVLVLLIGGCEGTLKRQRDDHGGFLQRYRSLARGVLAFLPGILGGYLLLPMSFEYSVVASALGGIAAVVGYGFAAGFPYQA